MDWTRKTIFSNIIQAPNSSLNGDKKKETEQERKQKQIEDGFVLLADFADFEKTMELIEYTMFFLSYELLV